jgi:Zn-dependent M28 family amino/carboxypeptidase
MLLEIASQLGADPSVQFGFFGDEESGAQGSTGYLDGLSRPIARRSSGWAHFAVLANPERGGDRQLPGWI